LVFTASLLDVQH